MTRPKKIALIAGGSLAGLLVLALVAAILVVRTEWFRNYVREKIVAAIEEGTGGRAELGSFGFSWSQLRADIRNLVIHGSEGPNEAPFLRAEHMQVVLNLLSPARGFIDLAYLLVETPEANVIVYPDGHTNVPSPRVGKQSDKTALATVVDLAVRRFELRNGSVRFGERKAAFDASGENLRAQLSYDTLNPRYTGKISMAPLHLRSGTNAPVEANVELPLTLERDRITLADARIFTARSDVRISGSMRRLISPRTTARVNARISLADAKQAAGASLPLRTGPGLPDVLAADIDARMDENRIEVTSAHMTLGNSSAHAQGILKDPRGTSALAFDAAIDLGQAGRMFGVEAQPEGMLRAEGSAALNGSSDYRVNGNVTAHNVSFRQNGKRIGGINLDTALYADPHRIDARDLRLAALGGGFNGQASLEEQARYRLSGELRNFDPQAMAAAFLPRRLPYDGVISGPVEATGDLRDTASLRATTRLAIAPGRRGIPVTGRIEAAYNGRTDSVDLGRSFVALPATRLDLSGTLGRRIDIRLVSRNLSDLAPALSAPLPVSLGRGGVAALTATVAGKLSEPNVTGHVEMTNFAVQGRPFTRLAADLHATPAGAAVTNASFSRGTLDAKFAASVGLRDWSPEPRQPLSATLSIRNADVKDVLALAGQGSVPFTGELTADARISGTVGDPRGDFSLAARNGAAWQEPYQSIAMRASFTEGRIDVPVLEAVSGNARLNGSASYLHARDNLRRGTVTARLATNRVSLQQFQTLLKDRPGLGGTVHLNGDLSANLWDTKAGQQFQIAKLDLDAGANGLRMQGKNYGDFTARAHAAGGQLAYDVHSDFGGSTIRVNGQSALTGDHATDARVEIANLRIEDVLALAGRRDIGAAGVVAAKANLSGSMADPHAAGTVTVANGHVKGQKFDRAEVTVNYSNRLIEIPSLTVAAGQDSVRASASFAHPPNDFGEGQVRFHAESNLQLARLQPVQQARPGLAGAVKLLADGAGTLRRTGAPRMQFANLNASLSAAGLSVNRKPLGDLTATATTRGSSLAFDLKSDLGGSNIQGSGAVELAGDYPARAQIAFAGVKYSGLEPLIGAVLRPGMDASVEGRADISGPAARPENLAGKLELARLEMHPYPVKGGPAMRRVIEVHNAEPIVATLNRSVVDIRNAHLVGPYMDFSIGGTAGMSGARPLHLKAAGNVQLELAEAFDPNLFASGSVTLDAAVAGSVSKPDVKGRLTLKDASLNVTDVANGLSDANGDIVFSGTSAVIQNLTGSSGGGKIALGGFVGFTGPEPQFRLTATARRVRIEAPGNVSAGVNANLDLSGTLRNSLLSGNVTILDMALVSHSDVGSMLSQTGGPRAAPSSGGGPLEGMRLDVRVRTSPDIQVRTSLTENLELDAQLTARGTAAHPGMLGKVDITAGDLVFFGSKYTVDHGTVSFYNPQEIDPILDVNLSTTVKGIDVTLSVSGPVDRMKLTYHSDPPVQFSDLVSLLATGKVPTTDPVLAARQPVAPQQSMEQMGASTVLGQAVANPVSGRLERLFGVTKLKIDPQITGASNTPQARLTLQQQVTNTLTFTYIQDVTRSNPQIIQVEWTIDPAWSAIAQRDVNGQFALDFFYKKRFK